MPSASLALVVDDHADTRAITRAFLEFRGWEVMEAEDGWDCLEQARSRRPDVVVLDLVMPGLDGWAVAAALKADEATRSVPILVLTAAAHPDDTDRALGAGCDAVAYKPIALADLLAQIDLLLQASHGRATG